MAVIGFYIFNFFAWPFSFMPFRLLYVLSDVLYFIIYYIVRYRRKVVFKNLRNSFPEKSKVEINAISIKFYKHFIDLLVETIKLQHIPEAEIRKRVQYNNLQLLEKYFSQGKSVITVVGHYGNWEWHCGFPLVNPHKTMAAFLPLNNKYFNIWMLKLRRKFGADLVPSKGIVKTVLELHKKGNLFNCAFVADQSPPKNHINYWIEFLNQETPVFAGAGKIANSLNLPVVYQQMSKIKRGYYQINIIEIAEESAKINPHEITSAFFKLLEKQIIQNPELWLWSHRRWKFSKKDWEFQMTNNRM